ncbi:phosphomannomutase/phosphoglucomutase [Deferribacter autotrophicus]|uniref:Phosphomannomutase/phosphoglucomutase n=1 Tax=Deferribacter autotrophicus TaxID=500465 RepID=A0A5A8F1Y2_9BACT|nr:phosphomannomutase/phosphoglucomutase [Deferribacter autotrophicus]KAA0257962.1 phosphomannomutase/phosphoglucomutase [Deferribacter autotrophicus]
MIDKKIFRQYDIRGIFPDNFNKETIKQITNTFAYQLIKKVKKENPTVTIGRDVRLSSDELFEGAKEGLLDAGVNVIDLGRCPTPVTYFSAFHLNSDGFIMITGSHNPPEYNGMKFGIGKETYHSELITSIYDDIIKYGYRKSANKGNFSSYDIVSTYIEWMNNHFSELKEKISKLQRKIKIVIDAGNGVASKVAPKIFKNLGVEVVELYCEEDGTFPNHHPDPTVEENLVDLINTVKTEKADFGIGYDGDADRIGVVDEKGSIIWGDMLLIIYAKELKKYYSKPKVIADVKASQVLFDYLEEIGAEPIMWKTGHSLIKDKLKETNAELAGEMSGHIFFNDKYFGYDDAIYSSVRFLEAYVNRLIDNEIKVCSDLLKDIPKVYNTPEIRFDCPEEKKFEIVNKLTELFKQYKNEGKYGIKNIIDTDGIRVVFDEGWGLLRASNTQPVLVMRFEAATKEKMLEYQKIIESELNKLI